MWISLKIVFLSFSVNYQSFKLFFFKVAQYHKTNDTFCVSIQESIICVRACVRALKAPWVSSRSLGRVPVSVSAPDVCAPHPIGILRALEKASLFLDQRSLEAPARLRRFEDKRRDSTSQPGPQKSTQLFACGARLAPRGMVAGLKTPTWRSRFREPPAGFMVREGIFFPFFLLMIFPFLHPVREKVSGNKTTRESGSKIKITINERRRRRRVAAFHQTWSAAWTCHMRVKESRWTWWAAAPRDSWTVRTPGCRPARARAPGCCPGPRTEPGPGATTSHGYSTSLNVSVGF